MSRVGSLFQAQKTEGRDVTDLRDLEIVSTTPNSAPNATFLRIPTESCLNHEVYHNTDLAASNDIKSIILLKDFQSKIDKCIYKFYSRRSIMAPLKNYFQSSPCDYSKISQVALLYLKPLMEFLVTTIEHVKDSTNCIFNVFVKTADYSTELLDNIFMLIYKLFCLDSIRGVKKQIYTDLSEFDRIFNVEFPHGNVVDPLTKKWLEDISPVMDSLVSKMKLLPPDKLAHASTSSYRYLLESLQTTPLIYETRYSHIISFAFFVKLCPNIVNPVDIPLVKTFFQRSTCVPLIYEYSYDFVNYFNVTILSDQIQPKAIDLETLHKDLRFKFLDLLTQLQTEIAMSQKVQNRSHLIIITVLSESIKLISSTTNIIREQYSYRIQNPCFEPSSMKPYERTVRHGFTQSELRAILQLLALCRELHDFILGNISVIYQKICNSIHLTFQEFVKNSLEKVYYKIKKNKQYFRNMITYIRTIAGDWTQNEEMLFKKPDAGKHEIHVRIASPSPQLIEFIRIQTQHLLTLILSMSQQIKKRGGHSWVEDCSIILKSFIQTSQNWIELLDLDQTLLVASDQSSFYFKEVQLDLNQEVQFPVRASLPFILCEFALDNYDQPDITDIIFYPLSIYDDAAYISIHKLKSSLIFNEICAEANVCLDTLSVLIGEFTFNAFKTFATLHHIPDSIKVNLKNKHKHLPKSQAYRLRTLLLQNQYSLLSKQVALETLISPRVDQELNNFVSRLYGMGKTLGISAALTISHMINIIYRTHHMMIEQGLPLMPFKDIIRASKNESLQTFYSKYLKDVLQHLLHQIIPKFILFINPLRFIPPKKQQLSADLLGKLSLGKILKEILEPTIGFISTQHFYIFFKDFSSGSITILNQMIIQQIPKLFENFLIKYQNLIPKLTRIKDSPFGTNTQTAFLRYENAYKFLFKDLDFIKLLSSMQRIGNIFMISLMIDQSLSMKYHEIALLLDYLKCNDEEGNPHTEIINLFDVEQQNAMKALISRPNLYENNLLKMIFELFKSDLLKEINVFIDDDNKNDINDMKCFASYWSIIEFVYCLMETNRQQNESNGFAKYGQGVFICAAIVILLAKQEKMYKLLGICRKVQRYKQTDFSGTSNEKILEFLAVTKMGTSAVDWAIASFKDIVSDGDDVNK